MTLLARLKARITTTLTDDEIIAVVLQPALDKLAEYVSNYKYLEVAVTRGTASYNLTSLLPTSGGVQDLIDIEGDGGLMYLDDYFFSNRSTLQFKRAADVPTGTLEMTYNSYYTIPTIVDETYTETDAPVELWQCVVDYAVALHNIQTAEIVQEGGVISKKKEANIEVWYGNEASKSLYNTLEMAEKRMKAEGLKRRKYNYLDIGIL